MRSLALAIVFSVAATSTSSAERAEPLQTTVENQLTAVVVGSNYIPDIPKGLDDIPRPVREKLRAHLIDRLGEQYFARLTFAGGQIIDLDRLYEQAPEARNFKWTVFAYRLVFRTAAPDKGITAYFAAVELDKTGSVLKEIELPPVRRTPHKAYFVPLARAYAVAEERGFDTGSTWAALSYDPKVESVIYRLTERTDTDKPRGNDRTIEIDAHNGTIVRIYDSSWIK